MSEKKQQSNRGNVLRIGVLFALIAINAWLALPTRSALSDSKKPLDLKKSPASRVSSEKPAAPKTASAPADDFGAETIEPVKGLSPTSPQFQSSSNIPLPLDLVEERDQGPANNKSTGATQAQANPAGGSDTGIPAEIAKNPSEKSAEVEEELPLNPDATVTTSLNGNEIDIAALVKTFSKLTKRNYIVDNNVKGKVAIHLATPVTIPEALRIFESVLLLKGFTTVPMGDNTWKVITAKDAKQTTIPMLAQATDRSSDALVTQLIRLKNTQATELQQVISQFVSKEGMVNAFGATNALIIIDSAANIKRLTKLVDQLDVPALDQDISIIPILHAEAKDVADKINEILGDKDSKSQDPNALSRNATAFPGVVPPRPGIPGTVGQPGLTGVATSGERRQLPLKLIPDDRTNSLICVADQLLTEKVRALAEQLDSPVDRSGGKFYVYRLQHADAEEMAQILSTLISGSAPSSGGSTGSSKKSSSKSSSSSSFGSSSRNRNSNSVFGDRDSDSGQGSNVRLANTSARQSAGVVGGKLNGGDGGEGGKVSLEGEVSIAADASTNSLVISASRSDYQKIKELIDSLDVKRRQVLVEATILEISLSKNEGMGVEWQSSGGTDKAGIIGQTNYGGLTNVLTNPKALSDLTIAAASSGSIVLPGGVTLPSQAVLITALSKNSNVNVLSTPTILATDNQEAEIKVGENVPFVTSTSTNQTNLNNTFNQIDREDVGIKLRITPQISAGNFVVLQIFIEISNVVAGTRNDPNGPTTTIRTTETMVEVKSNQMIVTGGLISDSVTDSSRGVPFFQDIPVLGNLFRRDDTDQRRTNLLVFITPRIIEDQFVAREQTMAKNELMEKEIEARGTVPDRSEVLHSPDIDHVVEEQPLSPTQPTTVTPPKSARASAPHEGDIEIVARKRTEERLRQLENGEVLPDSLSKNGAPQGDTPAPRQAVEESAHSQNGEEEIDLSVRPSLPGEGSNAKKSPPENSSQVEITRPERYAAIAPTEARASMGAEPVSSGSVSYVVLRALDKQIPQEKLPFRFADNEHTVGTVVPGNLTSKIGKHFQIGQKYSFQVPGRSGKNSEIQFVCIGKYGSLAEAKSVHPTLSDTKKWYTLNAEQASGLGKKQWTSGR